jgi:hypothetical protein
MCAEQGIGHTARRDTERFHYKSTKHKGKGKGGYQPLERVGDFGRPAFCPADGIHRFFFFVLSHKNRTLCR